MDVPNKLEKPRMRTIERFLCDKCDEVIDDPKDGFVIHGNVYNADAASIGGLIGNNLPPANDDGKVDLQAIRKTVLCKTCLLKTLGLSEDEDTDDSIGIALRVIDDKYTRPAFKKRRRIRTEATSERKHWSEDADFQDLMADLKDG